MYSAKFCINYSDKFNVLFSHSPSKLFEWKTDTKETDICVLVRIDVLFYREKKIIQNTFTQITITHINARDYLTILGRKLPKTRIM